VRGDDVADMLAHDPTARAAENITYEKNVQIQLSAFSFQHTIGSDVRGVSSSFPALHQNFAPCSA
jgi:hypothetical protein